MKLKFDEIGDVVRYVVDGHDEQAQYKNLSETDKRFVDLVRGVVRAYGMFEEYHINRELKSKLAQEKGSEIISSVTPLLSSCSYIAYELCKDLNVQESLLDSESENIVLKAVDAFGTRREIDAKGKESKKHAEVKKHFQETFSAYRGLERCTNLRDIYFAEERDAYR